MASFMSFERDAPSGPVALQARSGTPPGFDSGQSFGSIADVLRWRAVDQPDRLGYRFLPDGESGAVKLSYGELDLRARAIAATLHATGASGQPVLLVYPAGLEFVCAWFGCIYAGAIAVAVHPPRRPRRGGVRFLSDLAAIAGDAQPRAVLTTTELLSQLPDELRTMRWITTDGPLEDPRPSGDAHGDVSSRDDAVALLQYTSGSTSAPKGVAVTHANIMHNLHAISGTFWRPTDGGSVAWLPPQHDMGLIGGILAPLYLGLPVTLLPPLAFVQRPLKWLEAITRYRASISGGPNFAYELCVRRITPGQRDRLDLSSWRVAFNGAEPVDPRTIHAFTTHFAPSGFDPAAFKPCYGLAEATLLVSVNDQVRPPRIPSFRASELERHVVHRCGADEDGARSLVSCGAPVTTTVVVEPDSARRCPPDRIGEIWISGPAVAQGYWGRPAESKAAFRARLAADGTATGPFLRTGDLGFLHEGELYVTGRLKDLIIVDGTNHYPQDIERTVGGCHPALSAADCAAFSINARGREVVVIVAGARGAARTDLAELGRTVRAAVVERHDLPIHDVVFVGRGHVPKTASGKIRRRACRAAYLTDDLNAWREENP